jgi:hypothetical protein
VGENWFGPAVCHTLLFGQDGGNSNSLGLLVGWIIGNMDKGNGLQIQAKQSCLASARLSMTTKTPEADTLKKLDSSSPTREIRILTVGDPTAGRQVT